MLAIDIYQKPFDNYVELYAPEMGKGRERTDYYKGPGNHWLILYLFLFSSSFFSGNVGHYNNPNSATEARSGYPYIGQLGGLEMSRVH